MHENIATGTAVAATAARDDKILGEVLDRLLKAGKEKMVVRIALARKLLVRFYIMLRDQVDDGAFRRHGRAPRPQPLPVAAM